jgi:hypothetical protein
MSNSPGVTRQFMVDMLKGIHALGTTVVRAATTKDTFKCALFMASSSLSPSTTATYAAADGEYGYSSGSYTGGTVGDYAAGGYTLSNTVDPAWSTTNGSAAIWTPGSPSWSGVTIASPGVDAAEIYNSTQSNKVVAVITFGAQQITGGNFQLTMPTNDAASALIRFN